MQQSSELEAALAAKEAESAKAVRELGVQHDVALEEAKRQAQEQEAAMRAAASSQQKRLKARTRFFAQTHSATAVGAYAPSTRCLLAVLSERHLSHVAVEARTRRRRLVRRR